MATDRRKGKYRNYKKPWSPADVQTLIKLYPRNYEYRLARLFSRTEEAVASKAVELKLKKKFDDEFPQNRATEVRYRTDYEVKILKRTYSTHSFNEIGDKIGRSFRAVSAKAQNLKLKKSRYWTKREYRILRKLHKTKSYVEIAQILKAISKNTLCHCERSEAISYFK